jgi:hypothetical protein
MPLRPRPAIPKADSELQRSLLICLLIESRRAVVQELGRQAELPGARACDFNYFGTLYPESKLGGGGGLPGPRR